MRNHLLVAALISAAAFLPVRAGAQTCEGAGPQTPRDITSPAGTNPVVFAVAPEPSRMSLCDVHFHKNAEHKGPGFETLVGPGEFGGYGCDAGERLTERELTPLEGNHCENVAPGETIEVHWVYTTCRVAPGPGLGSCLAENCANPQLRVEAQVYLLVNDDDAVDFRQLGAVREAVDSRYQPAALPEGRGEPVTYLGSTTGPAFSDEICSPLQVTWSVTPSCEPLDISSLSEWCSDNPFEESGAHGGRSLVTNPELLSPIG